MMTKYVNEKTGESIYLDTDSEVTVPTGWIKAETDDTRRIYTDKIYLVMDGVKTEVKAVERVSMAEMDEERDKNGGVIWRRVTDTWVEYRVEPLDTQNNASNTPPAQDIDKVDTTDTNKTTEEI